MEGPSNGGLLYHEVQEAKLCAVHCVNTVLQGPFFSEVDLAALASDLDHTERQMLLQGPASSHDFLSEDSHNVSVGGDFSIQVLQKALEVWDLQVIPLDSPAAEPSKYDPELENAFICHLHDHWFCIRKVNGEWYNFNSLYAAPEHLSKFYLSAYLDTLKGCGWSIFLVRGNFPKECPISSEGSTGFGQWLTPEDAARMTKSCNQNQVPIRAADSSAPSYSQFIDDDAMAEQEEEDLNAAIAASLESSSFSTSTGVTQDKAISVGHNMDNCETGETNTTSDMMDSGTIVTEQEEQELKAAIAASLMDPCSFGTPIGTVGEKDVSTSIGDSSAGAGLDVVGNINRLSGTANVESSNSQQNKGGVDSSSAAAAETNTMSRHDQYH